MNKKVTILVACHKPDTVYKNDIYTPIHVGRAISKWNSEYSRLDYDFMLTNMIFYMQNLDINYKICIFAVL